jgi:adenosylhomocysteine nucleosidase
MLAVIGSLSQELNGLLKKMSVEHDDHQHGCRVRSGKYHGQAMLLIQSGMGRRRAERAAQLVFDHYPVAAMLSLGFGGALRDDLGIGEIVVCTEISCVDGRGAGGSEFRNWSDSGLRLVSEYKTEAGVRLGKSVTVDTVVSRPGDKRALAQSYGADVVDMEGYWLAAVASAKGVPFLAVRAVTDTLSDRLLPFEKALNREGEFRWYKAMGFVLRPDYLARLPGVYASAALARKNLTDWTDRLLEGL